MQTTRGSLARELGAQQELHRARHFSIREPRMGLRKGPHLRPDDRLHSVDGPGIDSLIPIANSEPIAIVSREPPPESGLGVFFKRALTRPFSSLSCSTGML